MAPPLFIAVQCCQCSTMQVKQQKKSSNKWNCVVCNQKQSVRQVFAQGSMAKDLRPFVQSFNMSRRFSENPAEEPLLGGSGSGNEATDPVSIYADDSRKQKRSDWTEYLDLEDSPSLCTNGESDQDIEIVTELPKDMFKKPRLKESSHLAKEAKHTNLYRPAFTKRHTLKTAKQSPDMESRNSWCSNPSSDRNIIKPDDSRATTTTGASKWNSYVTEDLDSPFDYRRSLSDETHEWNSNAYTETSSDQKVEDDIHPDFM